jgi:hypothetical protein
MPLQKSVPFSHRYVLTHHSIIDIYALVLPDKAEAFDGPRF